MDRPLITLTTDFGTQDGYVASMKGVILGIAPEADIVDITHDIDPQDIQAAAIVLARACPLFPPGTIHVGVVDPGVGTRRRAIAVRGPGATFIGPDNGLFTPVLSELGYLTNEEPVNGARAVEVTNPEFLRQPVSRTFHGRDVFAPAAAHLAAGVGLNALGGDVPRLVTLREEEAEVRPDGVHGCIVHIDRFGNAISNIDSSLLPREGVVEIMGAVVPLAEDYQAAPVVGLVGSTGRLEIAVRNGSAAATLSIRRGTPCIVRSQT